jgi:hypothetical protein
VLQPAVKRLVALLIAYFALSFGLLLAWDTRGVYEMTGDEPHYLVIADAIVSDRTLDVQRAYEREFTSPLFYPQGLAPPQSPLESPAAHVVSTRAGTWSWHGPGLPLLIAGVLTVGGAWAVKFFIIGLGALAVLMAWSLSNRYVAHRVLALTVPAAVTLGYPLIGANTQIYPDLIAGVFAAMVVWWLLTQPGQRWSAPVLALAAFLPWLGMKFAPASAVLLVAGAIALIRAKIALPRMLAILAPAVVIVLGLILLNMATFGTFLGAPTDGALQISPRAGFTALGLLVDQNHGVFVQNPTLLLGVVGIGVLWRERRFVAVTWVLVFLALWLPGAAHPNWYSPGSFVGRYSWALGVLLMIPAIVAFGALTRRSVRLAVVVSALGIAWNLVIVMRIALTGGSSPGRVLGVSLYTEEGDRWLESSSVFVYPLHRFFPSFTDPAWAWEYGPNWVWLALLALLLIIGFRPIVRLAPVAVGIVIVLAIAAFAGQPGVRRDRVAFDFTATEGSGITPQQLGRDMRLGPYRWTVIYAAPGTDVVGRWELVRASDGVVGYAGELRGTNAALVTEQIDISYAALQPTEYILRVGWYAPITVRELSVEHAGSVLR